MEAFAPLTDLLNEYGQDILVIEGPVGLRHHQW